MNKSIWILLVAAFSLSFAQPHKGKKHGDQRGFFPPYMINALQLDKKQKKKIMKFRYEQKKKMIAQRAKIQQLEEDLKYIFSQYPLDKQKVNKVKSSLIKTKSESSALRVDGMTFFISQLTEQQHARFVELQHQRPPKMNNRKRSMKERR